MSAELKICPFCAPGMVLGVTGIGVVRLVTRVVRLHAESLNRSLPFCQPAVQDIRHVHVGSI